MPVDRKKMIAAVTKAASEHGDSASPGQFVGVVMSAALRFVANEIDALESRVAALDGRLAKAQQQLSAAQKELAALARREPGQ